MLKFDFFNGLIEALKEKLNSWYLSPGIYDRKSKDRKLFSFILTIWNDSPKLSISERLR